MKLPSFKRLFSTDFPKEFQQLVDQLSNSLNYGLEVLYQLANNQISLRDNINCTIKDLTITVDSSGKPTQTVSFTLRSTNKVDGIIAIQALNQVSTSTYPVSGIFISGAQSGNLYNVNNITGLQPNQQYIIRVVAFQQ